MEQDAQSKRVIPSKSSLHTQEEVSSNQEGMDVLVPWVHNTIPSKEEAEIYHRYYHMFADGELRHLVDEAMKELDLKLGDQHAGLKGKGFSVVQEGWERSNYYIELLSWQNK